MGCLEGSDTPVLYIGRTVSFAIGITALNEKLKIIKYTIKILKYVGSILHYRPSLQALKSLNHQLGS